MGLAESHAWASSLGRPGMSAPAPVLRQVERFLRNRTAYHRPEYREHQVRQEFIDPVFEALGWDMRNRAGYAEAYKDVVTELPTRIGGTVRAPDYAFRVGGSPKFLVEAKAPHVDVGASRESAFQIRRYGYSMNLSLSILTDFEEFSFYDTRTSPSESDAAPISRVRHFKCEDIEREWRWLEGTFSKEAVLLGELDRFAEEQKQHRGTAGIDHDFLSDIENWRDLVAKNMALRNKGLTARELNRAVQQLIDRIVFLRIAEDRGIEPYGQLRTAADQKNLPIYRALVELFVRADHRYNSGLFHFWAESNRSGSHDTLSPTLEVDNSVLSKIIGRLYYPDSPYEFAVIPAELLGRIYERFLGKTIRLTPAHRAVVEDKPDVRLAGGVYYTPEYVVDYIVSRTLAPLLDASGLEAVSGKGVGHTPLSVVDIACGSGSFLLGAYSHLLDWYLEQYLKDDPNTHARGRPPRLFRSKTGQWQLTLGERNRILIRHIFGVDRDPQAVEKTKLSLLLKVLEGATETLVVTQLQLFQDRILPDLGENIKCGNSLVDSTSSGLQAAADGAGAESSPFSWEEAFPAVMANGGFDVVMGNPPYVRIQRIPHAEADYLFANYRTVTGKSDLSVAFLERALALMHPRGKTGMITSKQWTSTDYGQLLRGRVSAGLMHEIVSFGSLPVFENVETYPAIFIISKSPVDHVMLREVGRKGDLRLEALLRLPQQSVPMARLGARPWNLQAFDLHEHVRACGLSVAELSELAPTSIGDLTGMDSCFVVSEQDTKQLNSRFVVPYASRGSEVFAFGQVRPSRYVIRPYRATSRGGQELIPEPELRAKHVDLYRHLLAYRSALRQRKDSRKFYADGEGWYRHLRPGSVDLVNGAKLAIKGIDRRSTVALLEPGAAFNGANVPCMLVDHLDREERLALLALLNSKLAAYYLRGVCPPKLGGYTRFTSTGVNRFPLRVDPASRSNLMAESAPLAAMAEKLQGLIGLTDDVHGENLLVLRSRIDDELRRLDGLVYDVYEISRDDRNLIDAAVEDRRTGV